MNEEKKTNIRKNLLKLSFVFHDRKLMVEGVEIYCEMLSDLPEEAIIDAINRCLCECRFFPTIAEIRTNAQPYLDNLRAQKRIEDNERRQIAAAEEEKEQTEKSWNYTKEVVRHLEDKKVKGTATRPEIEKLERLREVLTANEKNN